MKRGVRSAIVADIARADRGSTNCLHYESDYTNMVKIYSKTGDTGETSALEGGRILKSDLMIEANGAVDEASSFIGWARETVEDDKARALLSSVQQDLYHIMAFLAGAEMSAGDIAKRVTTFESYIDVQSAKLPPLHRFILPQGGETTTRLHVARTMVRAAERAVVGYMREKLRYASKKNTKTEPPELLVIRYLNRLSDVLFVLARKFAQVEKKTK